MYSVDLSYFVEISLEMPKFHLELDLYKTTEAYVKKIFASGTD